MTYFLTFVGCFFLLGLVYSIYYTVTTWRQFKGDRNPFRRYCRKCGQRQEQMTRSYNNRIVWWEDMGNIPNPKCSCHKYSEYHS